jgi:hypothetical protein
MSHSHAPRSKATQHVKPQASKTDQRAEIEEQVREYLRRGGAVEEVARGISGRDGVRTPLGNFHAFAPRQKEERTYVPEVVAAIEARRRKPKEKAGRKRPRVVRRAVYDDFGEPIRWEWVEQDGK